MPQVIHFRIKFFETSCPCFDCPSAHSHPSFLMCLYVPGPHYLVNFFNLPYFTSQAGCFQQCLSGSDVNVRPTPQGLRIRLTWPLTFSLQIISSEFICTSMYLATLVHALLACHPSEIAVGPGCNGVRKFFFRCVYSTFFFIF